MRFHLLHCIICLNNNVKISQGHYFRSAQKIQLERQLKAGFIRDFKHLFIKCLQTSRLRDKGPDKTDRNSRFCAWKKHIVF